MAEKRSGWLKALSMRSKNASSGDDRQTRRPRALSLELLEDRAVPAVDLQLSGIQQLVGGANVNVSQQGTFDQSEMIVDVNPTNPLNVVAFTHSFQAAPINNFNQIDLFYSFDGGASWNRTRIDNTLDGLETALANPFTIGTSVRFDPTLAFDAEGRLYVSYGLNYLSATTGLVQSAVVLARSDDGGITLPVIQVVDDRPDVAGVPGVDKWHVATGLDPTTGRQAVYVAYTQNVDEDPDPTQVDLDQRIVVAGSNDFLATVTTPVIINDSSALGTDVGNLVADPAVGRNGELYVSWHSINTAQILFDRDLDGLWGNTAPFGNDQVVANLVLNMFRDPVPAQPARGIHAGPVLDVDNNLDGRFDDRLYIVFADGETLPDSNIFLATSDDTGLTWTVRTVDNPTSTEFLPWVDIDQTTSSVNLIYYTTDGDQATGNDDSNIRIASSINGGATWTASILTTASSRAFTRGIAQDFLEYISIAAHDGTIHGLWSDNRNNPPADLEAFTANASFNSFANANVLTVTGTAGNDEFLLRLSPQNNRFLEVWLGSSAGGNIDFAGLVASIDTINIIGLDGDDRLTIDFSNGSPFPVNGVHFAAGNNNDSMLFVGGPLGTVMYEATNQFLPHSGNVYFDGALLSYSALDTVVPGALPAWLQGLFTAPPAPPFNTITDLTTSTSKIFLSSLPAGHVVRLVDDNGALNGLTSIDSAGTNAFAPITFTSPTTSLVVGGSNFADTMLFLSYDALTTATITMDGRGGDDLIDGTSGTQPITLAGGMGDDTILGTSAGDSLFGGLGADSLLGGAGNDTLNGGVGDDYLAGESGDDTYAFENGFGFDAIDEAFAAGFDTIDLSAVTGRVTFLWGPDLAPPASATDVGTYETDNIEHVRASRQNDTFVFDDLVSVPATVDGDAGNDVLDYSRYLTGINVDLISGIATGTGGITNIENVFGSPGRTNRVVFLNGTVGSAVGGAASLKNSKPDASSDATTASSDSRRHTAGASETSLQEETV